MNTEDLKKISQRMIADGRYPATWAKSRGFHVSTVHAVLRNHYNLNSQTAQQIFEALRKDGYMEDKAA
jgi:DNA-binding LacI/PurR family transcriptional regulator